MPGKEMLYCTCVPLVSSDVPQPLAVFFYIEVIPKNLKHIVHTIIFTSHI